jgi:hypothetical protein
VPELELELEPEVEAEVRGFGGISGNMKFL